MSMHTLSSRVAGVLSFVLSEWSVKKKEVNGIVVHNNASITELLKSISLLKVYTYKYQQFGMTVT